MKLRIAIAADHGGFDLKQELVRRLQDNVELVDLGADDFDPRDDYPDYVESVARAVASGEVDRGVVICGSGVGACVAANKVAGVRASVCHDTYSAHQGVEHDDLNVLCLGARVVGVEVATELTVAFLMARFSGEERHRRRLDKVLALEQEMHSYAMEAQEASGDAEEDDSECPEPDALGIPAETETEELDDTDDE